MSGRRWLAPLILLGIPLAIAIEVGQSLNEKDEDALWVPITPPAIDKCIMVASPGGVGSSRLMRHILRDGLLCNDPLDRDGLKHKLLQRYELELIHKTFSYEVGSLLYIFDHPALVIASLYRRGYQHPQCFKLTGTCEYPLEIFESVENYAKNGTDLFHLGDHVRAPLALSATRFPIVIARSSGEALRDDAKLKKIADVLVPDTLKPYEHLRQLLVATVHIAIRESLLEYNATARREKYLSVPGFLELEAFYEPLWQEMQAAVPDGLLLKIPKHWEESDI